MKKILTSLFLALGFTADAQITLEHQYPIGRILEVAKLETLGYKYIGLDSSKSKVIIYNADHTLYKESVLTLPSGRRVQAFFAARTASQMLFNADAKIEFIVHSQDASGVHHLDIVNEDGNSIFSIPKAVYPEIRKVDGNWKLLVAQLDAAAASLYYTTAVYSLPGTYSGELKVPQQPDADTYSELSPNPVERTAIIRYQLPTGVTSGTVNVYDAAGRQIRAVAVQGNAGALTLDCNGMAPGVYSFNVAGGTAQSFIIK